MSRFSKLRELVTRANELEAEGRALRNPETRAARFCEADAYRAKAEYMAGRITCAEYADRLVEIQDAKSFPVG